MTRSAWDGAIGDYYAEHDRVLLDADARGPELLRIRETGRTWRVTQTIHDPRPPRLGRGAGVDLDASDGQGSWCSRTTAMRQLGG